MKKNFPLYDFIAPDNIKHTIWIMPTEFNQKIIDEFKTVQYLYIADGHHRAASASRVQKIKKERNANHTGTEEYNFFLAVIFPADQLHIMPYNRVVFDLNGLSKEKLLDNIRTNFTIEDGYPNPQAKKNFCMYIDKKWYLLKPNDNVKPGKTVGENLDVSILQNYLLTPVLGIGDPRTDTRIDFIGGIRGTDELEKLVDTGKPAVAFSLYPVSLDDLINLSDAGEVMPPKSTWFEPKLRDGLLVHSI